MVQIVKVEGEARVRDGSNLTTEFYEREFEINDMKSEGEIRSLVRKALIVDELKKTIKGFKSVRTMEIVDIKKKEGKKEDTTRLEDLMAEAMKLEAVPDNLDQYGSTKSKEEALERSIAKKKKADKAPKKKEQVEDLGYID